MWYPKLCISKKTVKRVILYKFVVNIDSESSYWLNSDLKEFAHNNMTPDENPLNFTSKGIAEHDNIFSSGNNTQNTETHSNQLHSFIQFATTFSDSLSSIFPFYFQMCLNSELVLDECMNYVTLTLMNQYLNTQFTS